MCIRDRVGPGASIVRGGIDRQESVVAAMRFAWEGYRQCGWGADQYKPTSCRPVMNEWGSIGMNLLDSLDTLWLLGMEAEFKEALHWVTTLRFQDSSTAVSVFETTIRALGGLLAAHALSREPVLLTKATDLGDRLLETLGGPYGLPCKMTSLSRPSSSCGEGLGLAELGTVQLEFRELSRASGNQKYAVAANKIWAWAWSTPHAKTGMFGVAVSRQTGVVTGEVTYGGAGDSFFEYLLKGWIQGGRTEHKLRALYESCIAGMRKNLLHRTPGGMQYVGTTSNQGKMEHLACFLPGLLALGAHTAEVGSKTAAEDMDLAKALMQTCYNSYAESPLGLGPERVYFSPTGFKVADDAPWTVHRPETVESLYILFVTTGDTKYQDWGWNIFTAMERCCKTSHGYGAHPDVRNPQLPCCQGNDDRTETYFFAETLKYLYLLFADSDSSRIDQFVFNTEAHPMPLPKQGTDPGFPLFI
eukprot:TRINITY_DN60835_c0_g1_i2.p1 TRINITY_DN60835_c0_g1~~TRINITY_DN60835_c0_g1_i2.p1  ORF type:complete len:473 (+),score=111.46 TRINITY_DN60835_c0_g1_i2:164-1582(+)